MKFMNYKGDYVEPKPLLAEVLVSESNQFVAVSTNKTHSRFDSRYGLQSKTFDNIEDALTDYATNLAHAYACGML